MFMFQLHYKSYITSALVRYVEQTHTQIINWLGTEKCDAVSKYVKYEAGKRAIELSKEEIERYEGWARMWKEGKKGWN